MTGIALIGDFREFYGEKGLRRMDRVLRPKILNLVILRLRGKCAALNFHYAQDGRKSRNARGQITWRNISRTVRKCSCQSSPRCSHIPLGAADPVWISRDNSMAGF